MYSVMRNQDIDAGLWITTKPSSADQYLLIDQQLRRICTTV
jgi:hypothetical protein